jgi:predicted DNA-binding transcriptional regulator AlpA
MNGAVETATLTAPQVAARLGISVVTFWKRRRAGQAPDPLPMDGHPRWSVAEVERFLAMDPKALRGRRRVESVRTR